MLYKIQNKSLLLFTIFSMSPRRWPVRLPGAGEVPAGQVRLLVPEPPDLPHPRHRRSLRPLPRHPEHGALQTHTGP